MGPETKQQAQEKLARFTPKIGYSTKWRDYSKVEIKKDDLVGNMMRAFMNENAFQLSKAGKPIDPEEWGMTPQTINAYDNPVEYQKRAKVLVEQFNEFEPLSGLHVNGELTLGENIADLTGLVIARQAYSLSLKGAPAPTLEGISADQRFYMGWAQSWKAKERDEALRQQVLTNVHSPEMYRANGPIRNIPEFYAAFGVKEGDTLFLPPDRRVKIW